MKKVIVNIMAAFFFMFIFMAAAMDSLPRQDVVVSDTDKIIQVKCKATKQGKAVKLTIPDKLFDLCISSYIEYGKDASKGAIIKMRVPAKYVNEVSKRILEICPSCKILDVKTVPVPTPTTVK